MKVRFKSFHQSGGVIVLPFMTYAGTGRTSEATAPVKAKEASSKEKGIGLKDALELISKVDGLPSDINLITSKAQELYSSLSASNIGMRSSELGLDTQNYASMYLQIVNQTQTAKYNKEEYDRAYEQASKNGALDEWAIGDRGQLICMSEDGDFRSMTAEQLKENLESEDEEHYTPLTNSQLLYYRAHSSDMAFQNGVLSVVQNSIGMEGVTNLIQNAMTSLGSSESSEQGYAAAKKGRLIQGLQDFENAAQNAELSGVYAENANDLYKYKFLTKSQAEAANAAFNYIYTMLPSNAKTLLKAKSDLTDEGAQQLVQTLVASKIETRTQFDVDLVGGTGAGSGTKKGGDGTSVPANLLVQMQNGIGGAMSGLKIDRNDGIQMTVNGRMYNLMQGTDGKPLAGDMSMSDAIVKSGVQSIIDNMQAVTFGDQRIAPEALGGITYNNTGFLRAILPKNDDGTVDFSVLESYLKAEQELDGLGRDPTVQDLRDVYDKYGLSNLMRADGQINPDRFGPFLLAQGYTTDKLSGVQTSEFVYEVDKYKDKDAARLIMKSLSGEKGKTRVDVDYKTSLNPADWFGLYDKIYKGVVYMPINENTLAGTTPYGEYLDLDSKDFTHGAWAIEKLYQNSRKTRSVRSTRASDLGLKS